MPTDALEEKRKKLESLLREADRLRGGGSAGSGYGGHKARAARRQREQALEGRDIGELPEVADPARKAACRRDLRLFYESYFPHTFRLAWCDDHRKVISQIERSVLEGGLFATAMPRGSGKTSLSENACLWAALYGHRRFIVLIASDEKHAEKNIESIKGELDSNDLLAADFPEVCYPISRLDGISNRCAGQLYRGKRTHIRWTADEVILPTIEGSLASSCVIRVAGLTGGIRGMKSRRPDGQQVRPSLVLLDDPQTDASARSPSQCQTRERIISGAVLGLAGPGEKISGLMTCTVVSPGDMADSVLDREKHPQWHGTRTKMVYAWPTNEALWEEYKQIRQDDLKAEAGTARCNAFYAERRAEMDAGAVVAWEDRYQHDELSAIQHAMNLRIDLKDAAFFAEYQNEPQGDADANPDDLTPDRITAKLNGHRRGVVPSKCNHVTAFIDVHKPLLYYAVTAWDANFGGSLVSYGTFPDQREGYFTLRDTKVPIADKIKAPDLEGQIYGALKALTDALLGREWPRDDDVGMKVDRCLIDEGWGDSTDIVRQFCRQSKYSAVLTPSRGHYIGASSAPMREWPKKDGEKAGLNWRLRGVKGKQAVRMVTFDANYWKSFLHNRLSVPMGSKSTFTLYGDKSDVHRMVADHLCAEYRVPVEEKKTGRKIDEWKSRPDRPDNHLFDCLVGCCVAASMLGVSLDDTPAPKASKKPRMSFAELQRLRSQGQQPRA